MARKKNEIDAEQLEALNDEITTETATETKEDSKTVTTEEVVEVKDRRYTMWFESNTDKEYLYFDDKGGVFTSANSEDVLKNCKKVKNTLYGNK